MKQVGYRADGTRVELHAIDYREQLANGLIFETLAECPGYKPPKRAKVSTKAEAGGPKETTEAKLSTDESSGDVASDAESNEEDGESAPKLKTRRKKK